MKTSLRFRTLAVHAGQHPDVATGALATPIVATSSFALGDFATGEKRFSGAAPGFLYSRFANPTVAALEAKMAALEQAEGAVACASGMAAISATLLGLLAPGDQLLAVGTLYGGTDGVLRQVLPRAGIEVVYVADLEALRRTATPRTRLVYVESPTNPTMDVIDLRQVAGIARGVGAISVVDNTFATPYLTRPLALGIDLALHSATKYIGGHGDATGGIVAGSAAHLQKIRNIGLKQLGGCMSPHDAFLFLRGLKTLPLRMDASCANALALARWLQVQPAVRAVFYPGLPSHPGFAVAQAQMAQFGAILSLELVGGREAARRFLDGLRVFTQAVSVGETDSLACHPASTTHSAMAPEVRAQQGVTEGLIRMSIGIEDQQDLLDDVAQALVQRR